ncbi:MAG: helix-turn-helix transcriptional regulator [Hydrogenoanaerobacterium sp.]
MTKEEIGAILKDLRLQSGKTQQQVAEIINRKQQIIGHWETGYSQPDANTLFVLCNLYGASIDEAFGFTGRKVSLVLSNVESAIIHNYRSLNKEGQEKIVEYIDDIVQSSKYKKLDQLRMGLKENAK